MTHLLDILVTLGALAYVALPLLLGHPSPHGSRRTEGRRNAIRRRLHP